MNKFEFELAKKALSQLTTKTALKKAISKHYSNADTYYLYSDTRVVHTATTSTLLQNMLYHFQLFETARDRYVELYKDTSTLPRYIHNNSVIVHVSMTIEEAHKWVKENE